MDQIQIIIDNAAVSLVPKSWLHDKKIKTYFHKYNRLPVRDSSKHQHLLQNIPKEKRLDRPDILHFGLLTILGYSRYLSTIDITFTTEEYIFKVDPQTRLPRSQNRFYGILEQLLADTYKGAFFEKLPKLDVNPSETIVFTPHGREMQEKDFHAENFIFGGFAEGVIDTVDIDQQQKVRLSDHEMELWTSLSHFINLYTQIHEYKL